MSRLAYLTSLYPAASHTFILREIAALRGLGLEVETCAIRKPGDEHLIGGEEREAASGTHYLLASVRADPLLLLRAAGSALRRPKRLASSVGLAWRTARPGLGGLARQAAYLAEALLLSRHLRSRGVTHLHNHFADPSASVAMLTSSLSGIPFSYTLHGPAELYEPQSWHLAEKTARATFVACISNFARSQAMYFSDPVHWNKLKIVHCGVLPDRYDAPVPEGKPGDLGPDAPMRLLFVGRLTPIKGLRVLLEAFAAVHAARPNLSLTLVGDGDDRAHLERLAAPLGGAVTFLGYRSQAEVARALGDADALVLPSFAEGLPVVLMEALAAGRPVIATRVAGVGELVEDGVSGLLVHAGDVGGLGRAIRRLAEDPALRLRMGQAGRRMVRAEFDVRVEAARIARLFGGDLSGGPRPEPIPSLSRGAC